MAFTVCLSQTTYPCYCATSPVMIFVYYALLTSIAEIKNVWYTGTAKGLVRFASPGLP